VLIGLLLSTALAATPPLEQGRYALFMRAATQSKLPVLGERPGASEAWVLVDVDAPGAGSATAQQTSCSVRILGAGDKASVRLGPGFVEALGTKQTTYEFSPDGDGWAVSVDLGIDHVGYDPAASGGALPKRADDPGVVDHEGDGHPGGTVIVDVPVFGEMHIYIAQRAHTSLHGHAAEGGALEGGVTGHMLDQRTLAATNPLMRVSPKMRPDPARSSWWMVPVPVGTTCETLAARACATHGPGPGCPDGVADADL
jgi:hypothetical protein